MILLPVPDYNLIWIKRYCLLHRASLSSCKGLWSEKKGPYAQKLLVPTISELESQNQGGGKTKQA